VTAFELNRSGIFFSIGTCGIREQNPNVLQPPQELEMPSAERVRQRRYTEADVQVLYLKYREKRIGPFVREVGDFIAHNKRDRGATLDATAFMFAQVAFFQTYQSKNKKLLEPKGDCGWWLRHYLLTKAQLSKEKVLKRATGLNRKRVIRAIKSWFPENSSFPTNIECDEPALLHGLASVFSSAITSEIVFDSNQAKGELSRIFKLEGINNDELDRFLIATAVLLSGKSVEIVPGFTAKIKLTVSEPNKIWLDENGNATTKDEAKFRSSTC
jgi:hypothetical protein